MNTNAVPAADTTTPTTVEIILAIYTNIIEAINSAGLPIATTITDYVGIKGDGRVSGIPVIYLPKHDELPTANFRFVGFRVCWRSEELIEVSAAHCLLRCDVERYCKYPIMEINKENKVKFIKRTKAVKDCPFENDMPTFSFSIFDMSDKIDELAEWVVSQASSWLLARHKFLK
jgi:hypothetical protein